MEEAADLQGQVNGPRDDSGKNQYESNLVEHPENETAPPSEKGEKTMTKPLKQPNLKIKQPTLSKIVKPDNTSSRSSSHTTPPPTIYLEDTLLTETLLLRHINEGAPFTEEQVKSYAIQAIQQGEILYISPTPSLFKRTGKLSRSQRLKTS